jgi:membrane-bound metal-dependent hydrolase YbcI (DUF457 family)
LDLYDFPWSHSLVTNIVWATAFALIYRIWKRDTTGAWVVWIGVLSHWVLDWITHRPDMPLYPGGHQRYGLGLWNSVAGTMVVELLMFVIGVWLYIRATRPRDRIGRYTFWARMSSCFSQLTLVIVSARRRKARMKLPGAELWRC